MRYKNALEFKIWGVFFMKDLLSAVGLENFFQLFNQIHAQIQPVLKFVIFPVFAIVSRYVWQKWSGLFQKPDLVIATNLTQVEQNTSNQYQSSGPDVNGSNLYQFSIKNMSNKTIEKVNFVFIYPESSHIIAHHVQYYPVSQKYFFIQDPKNKSTVSVNLGSFKPNDFVKIDLISQDLHNVKYIWRGTDGVKILKQYKLSKNVIFYLLSGTMILFLGSVVNLIGLINNEYGENSFDRILDYITLFISIIGIIALIFSYLRGRYLSQGFFEPDPTM